MLQALPGLGYDGLMALPADVYDEFVMIRNIEVASAAARRSHEKFEAEHQGGMH